jgi:hypothetical protein
VSLVEQHVLNAQRS